MIFQLPKIDSYPSPWLLCHPNLPKPVHGLNPRTVMGKNWWNIRRQEAYAKFDYHCWACGVAKVNARKHRWLEGHENYVIDYSMGVIELREIVALCHYCHMGIHYGFLQIQVNEGMVTEEEQDEILAHKDALLFKINCDDFYSGLEIKSQAKWEDWRLVIEGVKFPPKFKSYEEWMKHYNPNYMHINEYDTDDDQF